MVTILQDKISVLKIKPKYDPSNNHSNTIYNNLVQRKIQQMAPPYLLNEGRGNGYETILPFILSLNGLQRIYFIIFLLLKLMVSRKKALLFNLMEMETLQ